MTAHDDIRQLANRALHRPGFKMVDRLLRAAPAGAAVADVGANVGGWIPHWLELGARQVYAFEPVPVVFARLHDTYKDDRRVDCMKLAVSDRREMIRDCRVLNAHTLAPLGTGGLDLALEDQGSFDMQAVTLDSLSVHWPRLDLVKLDVDGYEPRALRGMRDTLRRFRPPIMLELSYLPTKLGESCEGMVTSLYSQGYRIATMDGEVCPDPLWVMEAFPWRTSLDVIAIPAERATHWPAIV